MNGSEREINKRNNKNGESNVEPGLDPTVPSPSKEKPPLGTLPKEYAISFSGCGFLGCYHLGAVQCFNKNGPKLIKNAKRVIGTSMGSVIAAIVVFKPESVEVNCANIYNMAEKLNNMRFGAMTPGFDLNVYLRDAIDAIIPDDIEAAQNRLHVCVTHNKHRTSKYISTFHNREFLIKCLLASCYIPMYSGSTPIDLDGEPYIDGGYSNNLPVFKDMYTITISPFSGDAIISPIDQNFVEWRMKIGNQIMKVNMHNIVRGAQCLFPPTSRTLHSYYEMGFRDAMRFLLNNGYLERIKGTEV